MTFSNNKFEDDSETLADVTQVETDTHIRKKEIL